MEAQRLHSERRNRVEKFLRDIDISPVESNSRNPLEEPWTLQSKEFTRLIQHAPIKIFTAACDETAMLTNEIDKTETVIDDHISSLYGLTKEEITFVKGGAK